METLLSWIEDMYLLARCFPRAGGGRKSSSAALVNKSSPHWNLCFLWNSCSLPPESSSTGSPGFLWTLTLTKVLWPSIAFSKQKHWLFSNLETLEQEGLREPFLPLNIHVICNDVLQGLFPFDQEPYYFKPVKIIVIVFFNRPHQKALIKGWALCWIPYDRSKFSSI